MRFAILASFGLHAALLAALSAGTWTGPNDRANVPIEVSIAPNVTTPALEPIPPSSGPANAPVLARRASPPRARPSPLPAAVSSGSSEAATEPAPGPSAAVDLTGETLLRASTKPAGGGASDTNGKGTLAGGRAGNDLGAASAAGAGDRSGGVSLEEHSWTCPWPQEADSQQIDEQTAVIKVVVGPDGRVESVIVVSDPGHGFGTAAMACARRTRFTPARDREGRPMRSESPPVIVRFTR